MKNKIVKTISNPSWIIKRLLTKYYFSKKYSYLHGKTHHKLMSHIFSDFNYEDYFFVTNEFVKNTQILDYVTDEMQTFNKHFIFRPDKYSWTMVIYYLIRKTKPEIFVETGVWYGFSSLAILYALHKNDKGKLFSIDYPAYPETGGYSDINPYLKKEERTVSLPKGKEPGFVIPNYLRNRWKLILGESKNELTPLLKSVKQIDFFLHDSLHTYQNMMFEFESGLNYLKSKGCIFSDNIDWHSAFSDFYEKYNLDYTTYLAYYESNKLKHNFGIIKK